MSARSSTEASCSAQPFAAFVGDGGEHGEPFEQGFAFGLVGLGLELVSGGEEVLHLLEAEVEGFERR